MKKLFARYRTRLAVTVISIRIQGALAFDWGWHTLTLVPRKGGRPLVVRTRFLEIWQKDSAGKCKIGIFLDNVKLPLKMLPGEVLAALGNKCLTG